MAANIGGAWALGVLAAGLATAGASNAQSYKVTAYVVSAGGPYTAEDYNHPLIGPPQFDGVGSFSITSPCSEPPPGSATCTQSGPTTSSPYLTSVRVSALSTETAYDYFNNRYYGYANTTAYANLANGTLGAFGQASPSINGGQTGPLSTADVSLADTLTFDIPGATPSTVTDVEISYTVYGAFLNQGGNLGDARLRSIVYFANGELDDTLDQSDSATSPILEGGANDAWVSSDVQLTGDGMTFTGVYALTGADPIAGVFAEMILYCAPGFECAYEHTGVLQVSLPPGDSYTSASGVFDTVPFVETVPEPATWALMLIGAGALGASLRRRRSFAVA